jgi:aquaporin Z
MKTPAAPTAANSQANVFDRRVNPGRTLINNMLAALRHNWLKYLTEAAALATFMISACLIVVLIEYPGSPLYAKIPNDTIRLYIIGAELGLTAYFLVASPWGKRSGPHMNPAFTLSFFLLGEIGLWDAMFYVIFQFIGGAGGVALSAALIGAPIHHPSVGYVITVPGQSGAMIAFIAEFIMSATLIVLVLIFSNSKRLQPWIPLLVGVLIGAYIAFEAPLSGMSINPARTFASAIVANQWSSIWVYFTAPVLGMVLASQTFRYVKTYIARRSSIAG